MIRKMLARARRISALPLALAAASASAGPFTECPDEAFLVQTKEARFYGLDLGSGNYRELHRTTDMGVINALGFSTHDDYLYGWDKKNLNFIRIHSDFSIEQMPLTSPLNGHYYVGDVSVDENAYFMYRRGSNALHGLWRIALDESSPDYLTPIRVTDGSTPFLNIFDIAFHPSNGRAYSVDNKGVLYEIDPATGQETALSNVGQTGTFGAVYFDVGGNLYFSNNKTGRIYRVDLTEPSPTAVYFSQGPSSQNNDGARCAFAPVPDPAPTLFDFGDAPDSYGTSLGENGARHTASDSGIFLGDGVDFETQAQLGESMSDDATNSTELDGDLGPEGARTPDEDGVTFVTSMSAGSQAIMNIQGGDAGGFLNAWFDFDQNGVFDEHEHLLDDEPITSGELKAVTFDVPASAEIGNTWARFRVASVTGLQANGGASDGEVEDHQITIAAAQPNEIFYPSSEGTVSVAFEDLWPGQGDYDLNDFVVRLRTSLTTASGMITAVSMEGDISAVGANFRNGFAISIDELSRGQVVAGSIEFEINGVEVTESPLEDGQSNAVFVIAENIWDHVEPAEGCSFYRTEPNCGESPIQFGFKLRAQVVGVPEGTITQGVFNPFLFASHGFMRSTMFSSPPGRPLEIHLKNAAATDLADSTLFGRGDDRSNPTQGITYQTEAGLPWGLEIGPGWEHPLEYNDLVDAYPDFVEFVTSGGTSQIDWFTRPEEEHLYRD